VCVVKVIKKEQHIFIFKIQTVLSSVTFISSVHIGHILSWSADEPYVSQRLPSIYTLLWRFVEVMCNK